MIGEAFVVRRKWVLLVMLLLLVTGIAASQLNADAVWYDEERTYAKVGGGRYLPMRTIPEMFHYITRYRDSWPPLYNLTFAGWGMVAGWSPYVMRTMALWFGLLSVAAVYRLGKDVSGSARVGLLSALLLGTAAFYMYYFHEMRGYTMSVFFALMGLVLYWRLIDDGLRWGLAVLLWLFGALLLYTHYISAFILGGIGIYHLIFARKSRHWWYVLGVLVLIGVSILPWFTTLALVVSGESRNNRGLDTWTILVTMLRGYGNGLWVVLPLMLMAALWYVRNRGTLYLGVVAVVFLMISLLANFPLDYMLHVRHAMALIPVVLVIAAMGLVALMDTRWRGVAWVLLVLWVIAGVWHSLSHEFMASMPGHEPALSRQALDTMLTVSETCFDEGDRAVFYLSDNFGLEWVNDLPLLHYFWTDVPFQYALLNKLRHIPDTYILERQGRIHTEEPEDYIERVLAYAVGAPRLWLFTLPELPQVKRLSEFEEAARWEYPYCMQAVDSPAMNVYVWVRHGEPLQCDLLPNLTYQPCTQDIVRQDDLLNVVGDPGTTE